VGVSAWSFTADSTAFTQISPQDGQRLSYTLPVQSAVCGKQITSPQLTSGVSILLRCGPPAPAAAGPAIPPTPLDADLECRYQPQKDRATLCFDQQGTLYLPPTLPENQDFDDLDDNDRIVILLLVPRSQAASFVVEVQGTVNQDEVRVQGAGSLAQLRNVAGQIQSTSPGVEVVPAGTYGPFSAPSFTVAVRQRQADGTVRDLRTTSFAVNPTYIATLRFAVGRGVGDESIRFNDYQLRTFSGETGKRIKNTASERDTREFVNLVFYGWPWQKRLWNGRDIRKAPAFWERINPLVGIGLDNLGEEYLAGISIELSRALDVFVARHFAQVKVLDGGFSEGDEFSGELADLPTVKDSQEDWVVGVSIDLRIAAQVLSSLFGGGGGS
jgi:hypothetical protein